MLRIRWRGVNSKGRSCRRSMSGRTRNGTALALSEDPGPVRPLREHVAAPDVPLPSHAVRKLVASTGMGSEAPRLL